MTFAVMIGATMLLSAFTINYVINWKIADGYAIKFVGTDAEGNFEKIKGDIVFDAENLASSKVSLEVEVTSIATGNWLKNRHAKSEKWFDADKYPTIHFASSKFSTTTNGYMVDGTLEMHGVKKPISIPFTFANNTFTGSFAVNRIDYGIGTMEGMSKKVSNEIKLDVTVPVTK